MTRGPGTETLQSPVRNESEHTIKGENNVHLEILARDQRTGD
jgi:hypothetical protein